ncbi:IclR family transcriptional regulator [Aureimonas fodinaquatilis]|uniref:IclR family transcriptional regulator n=1 Tax=Aureimonas fodinaquatilis TaxID=2565783 RepID=A0A5B0E1K0_9HYPH|nr:IclR family transcriptional regulator [Aureimonas fodinaquatilis]KAA0971995.1 IclR family transcriptional regulator [Aureimonas fodinaquatilis]
MTEHPDKNGVPVLERTLEVLSFLERTPDGLSIRDLTKYLGVPRSTVYRILNTLQAHQIVLRNVEGTYVLGPRLLTLAAKVKVQMSYDLVGAAQPVMQQLAQETGEGNKLSVFARETALVVAAATGTGEYGLHPAVGQSFPLHAGAASKMIMAHLDAVMLDRLLSQPLTQFTSATRIDPAQLRAELELIREQGWAQDMGEHVGSVCAMAAPVWDPTGRFAAALSIPFLAGQTPERISTLKAAVITAARDLSQRIRKL